MHIYIEEDSGDLVALNIDTQEGEGIARLAVYQSLAEYAEVYVGEPGSPDEYKTGSLLFGKG